MPGADRSPEPRAPWVGAKEALRGRIRAARVLRSDAAGAAFAAGGSRLAAGHEAVALYGSLGTEPDTWPLIEALAAGSVRVLLPVLAGRRQPDWAWYAGLAALRPGWHGIVEPTTPPVGAAGLAAVGLVVCSALAVTPRGERLGAGGGWYDRALAHAAPGAEVVALCFDAEVVPSVPTDPWDRRVDAILTERRSFRTTFSRE